MGGAGSPSNTMWPVPKTTSVPSGILIDPSSRLATTDMRRKSGGLYPFGRGVLGPHLTQCGQGRGLYLQQKWGRAPPTNFWPISIVAKRLSASRCHLVWREASAQATVFDRDPAPPRKKGQPPPNFWPMSMPLGTEVDLGPGHIVLDGDPAHTAAPLFSAHVYCCHGRPSGRPWPQ